MRRRLIVAALARRRRLLIALAVVPLVAAGALSGPVQARAAGSCPAWSPGTQPPAPSGPTVLNGIAVTGCDAWAVGEQFTDNGRLPLIERWNGSWQVVSSPDPGGAAQLNGVAALSASDVWAVGVFRDSQVNALVEHWDGSSWTKMPAQVPSGSLAGVSAVSPTDVWAVGSQPADGTTAPLIMHYDGNSWTEKTAPPNSQITQLTAVSAVSADDAWAVGTVSNLSNDGPPKQPVVLHWNGNGWTPLQAGVPDGNIQLFGVSAISATDVWAAGQIDKQIFVMHWDGSRWSQVTTPNLDTGPDFNHLTSVSAASDGDVWVAGYQEGSELLLLHWDGSSWRQVPIGKGIPGFGGLAAVSVSAGVGWVAGTVGPGLLGNGFAAPFLAVPDLRGDTPAQIMTPLVAAGLTIGSANFRLDCPVPLDAQQHVISTIPSAGTVLSLDAKVSFQICDAARLPDLASLTPAQASAALQAAGLAAGTQTTTSSCPGDRNGLVVDTVPAAPPGTIFHHGSTFDLIVCTTSVVPWVLTFDDASAENAIRAAGLTVGTVTLVPNCTVSPGDVVSQSPQGNTTVAPGSAVNLTESNGRQSNGKPCTRD